jgi:SAM-dependent methyltransferase
MGVDSLVCDTCQANSVQIIKNTDAFTGHVFKVLWCERCGLGRTDVSDVTSIEAYYPPAYYGEGDRRFIGVVEALVRLSRRSRARFVARVRGVQTMRLLDHGCGRGVMLAYLREHGWSTVGTESSIESSEYARGAGLSVVIPIRGRDPLDLVEGPFGVITAWHVVEHLDKPGVALRRFNELLEIGGQVVLEVPNFSSVQARLGRGDWIYTECPRHLMHFSPKGLLHLLSESGFEVKVIRTLSLEYGIFGLLQSLLNLLCPTKNMLFHLLRNSTAKPKHGLTSWSALISVGLTLVLFGPLLLVSAVLEVIFSFMRSGGIIRVVAEKRKHLLNAKPSL